MKANNPADPAHLRDLPRPRMRPRWWNASFFWNVGHRSVAATPLLTTMLAMGCGGEPSTDTDPTPLVEPSSAPSRPTVRNDRRITSGRAAPLQLEASATFVELAAREQGLTAGHGGVSAAPLPLPASSAPPAEPLSPAPNETQASPLVTPASAGPSPAPAASFQALLDNLSSFPPDTNGAAGPNHLMVTLNTQVAIQTRAGAQLSVVSLLGFWSPVYSGSNLFDPTTFATFNGATRFQTNSYTFSNTTAYQQHRLRFTSNHGNASRLQMTEIQMF